MEDLKRPPQSKTADHIVLLVYRKHDNTLVMTFVDPCSRNGSFSPRPGRDVLNPSPPTVTKLDTDILNFSSSLRKKDYNHTIVFSP